MISNACRGDKLRNVPTEQSLGARSVGGKGRGADLGKPPINRSQTRSKYYPRLPLANLSPL